jgi:hypothetical protein
VRYVADTLPEETQRLLLPAGDTQSVTPQTSGGAYVTVCRRLEADGALRDVLAGDSNRFVKANDRLTFRNV